MVSKLFVNKNIIKDGENKFRRKGYILIEAIIYITIVTMIMISAGAMFNSVAFQYKRIVNRSELIEISYVVEDKIRMEFKNTVGIIRFENPQPSSYLNMKEISGIVYDVYDKDNKEILRRKKIILKGSTLYIGETGIYQCGNYIDKMYVKLYEDELGKDEKVEFIIIYKKDKYSLKSSFTIFFSWKLANRTFLCYDELYICLRMWGAWLTFFHANI